MGFFVVKPREKSFRVVSVVGLMEMDIFFWFVHTPTLVLLREKPEFHGLMKSDKSSWSSGMAGYLRSLVQVLLLVGRFVQAGC